MARRTFDVVDVTEIFTHWYAGRSISELSVSLGVDRKTIRKYLAPAVAAGLTPGGPAMSRQEWADLVTRWFPQLADTRLRQITWPQIAVFHEYIAEHLAAGVTQATIHQRLRDEHGLTASVASLKRYVAANMAEQVRRDRVVVLRGETDYPPERKPRSTTVISGPGSIRRPGDSGGYGRSRWSWPRPGTCSSGRS